MLAITEGTIKNCQSKTHATLPTRHRTKTDKTETQQRKLKKDERHRIICNAKKN